MNAPTADDYHYSLFPLAEHEEAQIHSWPSFRRAVEPESSQPNARYKFRIQEYRPMGLACRMHKAACDAPHGFRLKTLPE
jgi:hypothetical protein